MKFLNKFTSCAAAALILLITAPATMAASWPTANDKITIVVPFKTGGSTDRLARSIAQYLPKHLNGAPVTVVNKPGASGAVGSSWFLHQPDDGHKVHFCLLTKMSRIRLPQNFLRLFAITQAKYLRLFCKVVVHIYSFY